MTVSTERLFALPTFEGLRVLRRYSYNYPEISLPELVTIIKKIEADGASLDMEAAISLHSVVDTGCPLDGQEFYQACITGVVVRHQPIWSRAMRQGLKRFLSQIKSNVDDEVIFRSAGLLDDPPLPRVVSWWDEIVGITRLAQDMLKMTQAREAERLSLAHEKMGLLAAGITENPKWIGLDDNFAGYDVLSYEHGEHGLVNKLIEVKSTIASPLRFYVSRNEWDTAKKAGRAYLFHIWDMSKDPPVMYIRTVAQIEPHVPSDNADGKWSNMEVPLGA